MIKIALLFCALLLLVPAPLPGADPPVSPNGIALYPDYISWRIVAPAYRPGNGGIRVITGNDVAIAALRSQQNPQNPMPDGSVLAKVTWAAAGNAVFPSSMQPGEFRAVEFIVKDSTRFGAHAGWGFARFVGTQLAPYGKGPDFDNECFACHKAAAKTDYLFTHIGPTP